MREYRRLLVPFDFSNHARLALDTALDLARRFGSDLHLLHVIQPPLYATPGLAADVSVHLLQDLRDAGLASLRQVTAAIAAPPGRVESHVLDGVNVASAIVQAADEIKADLIVMGTHGRTGLKHALMGSVAERTLRAAACPVLTVRSTDESQKEKHS